MTQNLTALTVDAISAALEEAADWQEMLDAEDRRMQEYDLQVIDGYSVGQMRAAFDKVKNPENWKLPICAGVHKHEIEVTRRAIMFFAGSEARFAPLRGDLYVVEAAGYYADIGA
jgi:hypothetical protein